MIRVIVRTVDPSTGIHIGGPGTPVETSYRCFDVEAPELEAFLREDVGRNNSGVSRSAIGVELVECEADDLPY